MSSWRKRYDKASREILVAERFIYRRECLRNGTMPAPSFRAYVEYRANLISVSVWSDRMECRMPDMRVLHALLVLERYLRMTADREKPMPRDKWIEENSCIRISSMEVGGATPQLVMAGFTISRVGSIWNRDEEYHVYVLSGVLQESEVALANGNKEMSIVTPMFVFRRQGKGLICVESPEIRGIASARLGLMISNSVAGGRKHG